MARKLVVIVGIIMVIVAFVSIAIANQEIGNNNIKGANSSTQTNLTAGKSKISQTAKIVSQNGLTIVLWRQVANSS